MKTQVTYSLGDKTKGKSCGGRRFKPRVLSKNFVCRFFVFRRCPSDEESISSVVDKILGRNSEVAGSNPGKIEKLFFAKMISF